MNRITGIGLAIVGLALCAHGLTGWVSTQDLDQTVKAFLERHRGQWRDMKGDAHELVPQLEGPFDFVFSDADKGWYTRYLQAVLPKLEVNGCFTAHNVTMSNPGIKEFLDYLRTATREKRITRSTLPSPGRDHEPGFRLLAENELEGYTLASPAISDGQMFIRTEDYLYCIGKRLTSHGSDR
ncbi:hypothetical protein MYX84_04420 [Acidobacteria bacterium AH-259-O06]|nr:hypothetical protein [Acidobacteria bacterium AH-259-O06]